MLYSGWASGVQLLKPISCIALSVQGELVHYGTQYPLTSFSDIQNTLQTYSFEDICNHNDIPYEEAIEMVVEVLVNEYNWVLPKPEPL